ncbi:MAG: SGNH/GDSL hydrolase family protein [Ruminococcus sp.]|nr:SGNH/GDSL hydrolase family protein [Ruminococcus sp.]
MKRSISLTAAVILALSLVSCDSAAPGTSENVTDSSSQAADTEQPSSDGTDNAVEEIAPPKPEKAAVSRDISGDHGTYLSNTFISTGNNDLIYEAENITYRAYLPVEEYGELEYKFYFSNTVDSTYGKGKRAYVSEPGGEYFISGAFIADGGASPDDEITNYTPVTFSGETEKAVSSGETYWSDSVVFDVPEGHYLVWEWTITGENIPVNAMSQLTKTGTVIEGQDELGYCDQIPLPQLIGAKRDVKLKVAAIGDSITQGCQTEYMAYEFWAARIAQELGEDYSFYNCGLGYSRASDAATDGDWLERASNADTVIVAFGTNDIVSGEYGGNGGNTAAEIEEWLGDIVGVLKEKGCEVIVFTAPPQDYNENLEAVRAELNGDLPAFCAEHGAYLFDFASLLCDPETPAAAKYGGHPNGEGGAIVAEAFMEEYSTLLGK